MFTNWRRPAGAFAQLCVRGGGLEARKRHRARRLTLEPLESRTVLSFFAPVNYGTGGPAWFVVAADLKGDHVQDLVTGNSNGTVSVLLGNGDGTFQAPHNYVTGQAAVESVVVGDFNGDGKLDLVTSNAGPNTGDPGSLSLFLGNGDGTFQAAQNFDVFGGRLAVGDFNGDGKLDLVTSTGKILLGNGDGTFQAPHLIGATGAPAVGDFDHDGKLDIAVAPFTLNGQVSVLLGNGDGTFQAPRNYGVGSYPNSVAVGDLNGDGVPDLVVANGAPFGGSPSVSVLLGNGDGTFQAARNYDAGQDPDSVALGDFNGDGKLDVVVINAGYGTVSVLPGNGDGSLQAPRSYDVGIQVSSGLVSSSVAVADFNGDGALDLAVANAGGGTNVSVRLNNGDGTFQALPKYDTGLAGPSAMVAGDFNGDGIPDIALASTSSVIVLLGNGDGSFQAPLLSDLGGPAFGPTIVLTVGDFNGDGKLDLVVSHRGEFRRDGSLDVLLGRGDGTFRNSFHRMLNGVVSVAVGDVNGDNRLDLVVPYLGSVGVFLGNGDGTFQAPQIYPTNGILSSVAVADLNNDGHPDIVTANVLLVSGLLSNQFSVSVMLGNGDGSFRPPQTIFHQVADFVNSPSLAVADLNGDGRPDLVVWSGSVFVLLGNGDGTFQPAINAFLDSLGNLVGSLALADFNHDGRLDLAVGFVGGNGPTGVGVLLGNGDGTFQPASVSYGSGASVGAVADFNGDGFPDVATLNLGSNTVSVLLNAADWPGGSDGSHHHGHGHHGRHGHGHD
jgi:hypothetical protein